MLAILASAPARGQLAGVGPWHAPGGRFSNEPHPAVARIIVPEIDGTAYGSGTLIDKRDEYGLVLTNWHVVEGARETIEVQFPDGFRSQARALKVDSDWDLAALVIWKPNCEPVRLASRAPVPGDILTICGYGSGNFRRATGRCTQYYSPQIDLPRELVELDVEARQGDSGGPILNDQGELAGVLFGAGRGTTLGSFEGRVKTFLATLAPDIGLAPPVVVASSSPQNASGVSSTRSVSTTGRQDLGGVALGRQPVAAHDTGSCPTCCPNGVCPVKPTTPSLEWGPTPEATTPASQKATASSSWPELKPPPPPAMNEVGVSAPVQAIEVPATNLGWFDPLRNALALIGAGALLVQGLKLAR